MTAGAGLHGQAALVTGAGGGLGRAVAVSLAAAGVAVTAADVDEAGLAETLRSIRGAGGTGQAMRTDVTSRGEVLAAVDATCSAFGGLDIVATVAGIGDKPTALTDLSEESLDRVFAVNVKGTLYACQEAARVMIPRGRGRIVTMASTAIDMPQLHGNGCYGITKAGVVQLTRVLAHELAPHGITVNALAPGPILTSLTTRHWTKEDGSVDSEAKSRILQQLAAMSPLGILGRPEDVAAAVLYLVGSDSGFVTGQILRPNGGCAMPW